MAADIVTTIIGPAIGGIIAAVAGWRVTQWDRNKERKERQQQWYMSVYRPIQEVNTSSSTGTFMQLGTDQQRQIQKILLIADQLDKERYRAPPDIHPALISSLANMTMYACRLDLDIKNMQLQECHFIMLRYAEEIQYYVQQELDENLPTFSEEQIEEIESWIEAREEMGPQGWQREQVRRLTQELNEHRRKMMESQEETPSWDNSKD